jgi:sulfur relay (sulfurtransferase) complex TusBCD TusD component (DsrE family)
MIRGMAEEARRLGILLTRGPGTREARWAAALARAAARRGISTRVFLMDEGAHLLAVGGASEFRQPGVRVSACTQTVLERDLPTDVAEVDYASQFQLARIVASANRFVSL